MQDVTAGLVEFIRGLGVNQRFATLGLLHFGKRSSIDSALSRLVQKKVIMRLARGIFILVGGATLPSAEEIMETKSKFYNKEVIPVAPKKEEAQEQPLEYYASGGAKTSFQTVHGRLKFKPIAPRSFRKHQSLRMKAAEKQLSEPDNTEALEGEASVSRSEPNVFSPALMLLKIEDLYRRVEARLLAHSQDRDLHEYDHKILRKSNLTLASPVLFHYRA